MLGVPHCLRRNVRKNVSICFYNPWLPPSWALNYLNWIVGEFWWNCRIMQNQILQIFSYAAITAVTKFIKEMETSGSSTHKCWICWKAISPLSVYQIDVCLLGASSYTAMIPMLPRFHYDKQTKVQAKYQSFLLHQRSLDFRSLAASSASSLQNSSNPYKNESSAWVAHKRAHVICLVNISKARIWHQ